MKFDHLTVPLPAAIGMPFEGGFFGGLIQSHGGAKTFAVVWAPKAEGETTGPWLPGYDDVPGARSCFHSMDNTLAMADAGSEIAKWARGLSIGGHTDWCIPARDVLELAYRHLKPTTRKTEGYFRDGDNPSSLPQGYPYSLGDAPSQTAMAAFQEGGAEAFEPSWYWASTQYSSFTAWGQTFDYGSQLSNYKSASGRVRAVRLIQVNS